MRRAGWLKELEVASIATRLVWTGCANTAGCDKPHYGRLENVGPPACLLRLWILGGLIQVTRIKTKR